MLFSEFGKLLSEERIKRGLSVDDIASRLKIRAKVVRALEEGNISDLPHSAYVSSFIKSYGNFLELDADEIRQVTNSIDKESVRQYTQISPTQKKPLVSRFKYYIAIILLLLLTMGGIWYLVNSDIFPLNLESSSLLTIVENTSQKQDTKTKSKEDSNKEISDTVPKKLNIDAESNELAIDAESKNLIANTSTSSTEKDTINIAKSEVPEEAKTAAINSNKNANEKEAISLQNKDSDIEKTSSNKINAEQNTSSDTNVNGAVTDLSATMDTTETTTDNENYREDDPHRIIITALEECWISSNADGTSIRELSLLKGSTYALSFKNKLILRFGNAGGVRIHYNGKDLPPVGKIGEVKTVTFPPEQE